MKRLNLLLTILLSFGLLSCGDDNDSNDNRFSNNIIELDGKKYDIVFATLIGTDVDEESNYTFALTTRNTDSGQYHIVNLCVNFPTQDGVTGTYGVDKKDRLLDPSGSNYMYVTVEGNELKDAKIYGSLTDGACTIKHNKDKDYTISFKLKPVT